MTPPANLHVLLIENDPIDALAMRRHLRRGGPPQVSIQLAGRLSAGLCQLRSAHFDAVLLGPCLPDSDDWQAIRKVKEQCNGVPLIVVSGGRPVDARRDAVRAGASDFLHRDQLDPDRLLRTIRYSVEHTEHQTTARQLKYARYQFRLAREQQQHLFPRQPPVVPGYDLYGHCRSAESTGGDFFDFIPRNGCVDLCIGDAAGHGMVAAMMMTIVRSVVRTLLAVGQPLNRVVPLIRQIAGPDFPSSRFMSLLVASLHPSSGVVQIASAGQPAMIFAADDRMRDYVEPQYPVIMMDVPTGDAPLTKIRLAPGEILLLYTDGITEAPGSVSEMFGSHRMEDVVARFHHAGAESIVKALLNDVTQFQDGVEQQDDMTLVVVKRLS